jgi:3-dehydroquinate dehydratase-1
MTARKTFKAVRPQLVAVISSADDLDAAVALKQLPDLFELRLDCFLPITNRLEKKVSRLRAPLIITARDPREGGANKLSFAVRRDLLIRFLPRARYIDIELRLAGEFKSLLADAKKRKVARVLSYHNFKSTPSVRSLFAKAKRAKAAGADIFKVATRTDTHAALARLVDFMTSCSRKLQSRSERACRAGTKRRRVGHIPVAVMGIGKFGAISRLLLARCDSALNYAAITRPNVQGQLSIDVLRSALPR